MLIPVQHLNIMQQKGSLENVKDDTTSPPPASAEASLLNFNANCCPTSSNRVSTKDDEENKTPIK